MSWNFAALDAFKAVPIVSASYVKNIVARLHIDEKKADETETYVQSRKAQDKAQEDADLKECRQIARRSRSAVHVKEKRAVLGADAPNTPSVDRRPMDVTRIRGLADIRKLPNALDRVTKLGLLLTRVKRAPATADEIEQGYRDAELYSAPWENPARASRVRWVADRISATFDDSQMTKAKREPVSFADVRAILKLLDDHKRSEVCPGVDPAEYRLMLSIADHCLGKNSDKTIPGDWIAKQWEAFRKLGIVTRQWKNSASRTWTEVKKWWKRTDFIICNFKWRRGHANEYVKGENFPKGEKRHPSPYTYPKEQTHTQHNTLDASASRNEEAVVILQASGLPPPRGSPDKSQQTTAEHDFGDNDKGEGAS